MPLLRTLAHLMLVLALLAGGVDVIEITLRSAAGLAAIEAVARAVPAMQVGAGTVTRASEVAQVLNAGARFALSPGSTPALIDAVLQAHLPFIPGVVFHSYLVACSIPRGMKDDNYAISMWKLTPIQHEYVFIIMLLRCSSATFCNAAPCLCKTGPSDDANTPDCTEMSRI